jgi:CheY-like chemotaxis protein
MISGTAQDRLELPWADKTLYLSGIRWRGIMQQSRLSSVIVIVEDLDWIRSGMRKAVEREGYRVAEATNESEAIAFAEQQSVDVILTEEELPTFPDLMAGLSTHPTLSEVPVVIINPDCADGARYADAYLLADYADIASFLAVLHR